MPLPQSRINKYIEEQCQRLELDFGCGGGGPESAEIVCVGEYPGETEIRSKRPMTGGSGKLMWECLNKMGIKRQDVYVTNVIKRRIPPSADGKKKVITEGEQEHWEQLLAWELSQLPNVKVIVSLGGFALNAFLNEKSITNWRGSIVPVLVGQVDSKRTIPIVFVNNPANALRNPSEEVIFRFHINKLKRVLSHEGYWISPIVKPHYNPTFDEAVNWISGLHYEAVHNQLPISFDIETIAGETACIGFAYDSLEGYCINFRTRGENRYTLEEEAALYRKLQGFFNDPRVRFVAQNGNFDSYWLGYKDRLMVHGIWHDTMLAHHLLYPRLPHDLGFLCSQYTDHPFYKDQGAEWKEGGDMDSFWDYNVRDCCITLQVAHRLEAELKQAKLDGVFHNHIMRAQPKLLRATMMGILVDEPLKETIKDELEGDVADLREDFYSRVSEAIVPLPGDSDEESYRPNPGSNKQMRELYFGRLKLIGKGLSVDAANRVRMYNHPRTGVNEKAIITAHNKWAEESKFLTTYAKMRIDEDTRVRCEYKQTGVQSAPGRLSSSAVMWGSGMNLQNQPERAKKMFIADPGYVFCYFDLSQAEARAVAYFADIPQWKEQFEQARLDGEYDCHRALAAEMFHVPYKDVPTKDRDKDNKPTIRYIAKRCRHGLNYRMAASRLAEVTGLPRREAEAAYNIYHRITPELRDWWDSITEEYTRNKVLTTPYGRRLVLMERVDDHALESIVAFKPQSTIGDKVVEVWYQCEDDPDWPAEARICLNVHDALIALAPIGDAARVLSIMQHYAELPITIGNEQLIIPAELGISVPDERGIHRWSDIAKIKSPAEAEEKLVA